MSKENTETNTTAESATTSTTATTSGQGNIQCKSGPEGASPAQTLPAQSSKPTRYSDAETELLERLYREEVPLPEIAKQLDRTERSVRAKLSSLGLYKKQPYLNKNGEIPKKKEEYVSDIASILEVDESLIESLEKCTKFTLKTLLDKLTENQE